ncbi:serine/threonine-protein kinase [Kutzneria kofuensis]|uniref:serine/threonine-protein kinase n=1 Tax=Kutzneria kofuensis TaxID=103725 RepID=UPI0031E7244D
MRPLGTSDPVAVGQYRTIALLGRGRTGRVLLGMGPDGRLVALRLLQPQLVRDEGFRREVTTARQVAGPSTAPILDGDLDAPVPWLATAFVAGPSLRQAGRLPAESVLVLASGIAAALAEIHAVGLLHRNLNPVNVLLADDGPKVIDFGITHGPGLAGSPGFLAPEQAAGQPWTWAGDVFAYGTVLYTAATGKSPFAAPSPQQTLANVMHMEPDLGAVPDTLRWIVGPCLAKDPSQRPTPAQIVEAIGPRAAVWPPAVQDMIARRRAEAARTVSEPPTPGTPPPSVETPEARRKTATIVGAAIVFTVFVTALAGVLLAFGGGPRTDAATTSKAPPRPHCSRRPRPRRPPRQQQPPRPRRPR